MELTTPFEGLFDAFTTSLLPYTSRADVHVNDNEMVLSVELPGVDKENIRVSLKDRSVVIEAEKKYDTSLETYHQNVVERYYGKISRSFFIPSAYSVSDVKPKMSNGVLVIRFPKSKESVTATYPVE
jgi:HSP20 family protein